jgi:F-type H+-transporting ATPase subunit a
MMNNFATTSIHISLASETLFSIAGFRFTNAALLGLVGLIIFLSVFFYTATMIRRGRYNRFIGIVQWAFEGMLSQINSVIPDKVLARKITPLAMTIFFFVLISYWLSILPGFGAITYHDAPIFRSLTADLNFTLAIMLIVMVTVQFYAIKQHGTFGNLGRYLRNPFRDPLGSFEGALELIGEVSRGLSLSLRLFGNCFAGEVLLLIISVLTSYFSVVALPFFMAFELFIGVVQAYVFFILTLIFTSLAVDSHGSHDDASYSDDHSPSAHLSTSDVARE